MGTTHVCWQLLFNIWGQHMCVRLLFNIWGQHMCVGNCWTYGDNTCVLDCCSTYGGQHMCVRRRGITQLDKKEFSAWFQGLQAPATDFSKKLESMAAMPMSHLFFSLKMKREREGWATSTSTITWGQLQSDFRLVSAWSQELQAPATDFSKKTWVHGCHANVP